VFTTRYVVCMSEDEEDDAAAGQEGAKDCGDVRGRESADYNCTRIVVRMCRGARREAREGWKCVSVRVEMSVSVFHSLNATTARRDGRGGGDGGGRGGGGGGGGGGSNSREVG
jgi:hypothetical protein